jgi:hypothetical protein
VITFALSGNVGLIWRNYSAYTTLLVKQSGGCLPSAAGTGSRRRFSAAISKPPVNMKTIVCGFDMGEKMHSPYSTTHAERKLPSTKSLSFRNNSRYDVVEYTRIQELIYACL